MSDVENMEIELNDFTAKNKKRREATAAQDFKDRDDSELHTLSSKAHIRESLEEDIANFLKNGGEVKQIAPNVMADPPKKPESNYGGRPI